MTATDDATPEPYTPTDEEVATRYVDARYQYSDARRAETRAEFDRFLARVRRDAFREGQKVGVEDALLACEIASGIKPGPPPGPTPNPYEETP